MALNRQVFRTRATTAVIFAALMLIGILWNYWSLLILITVIHFGCWSEYIRIIEKIHEQKLAPRFVAGLLCGSFAIMLSIVFCRHSFSGLWLCNYLTAVVGLTAFVLLLYNFISLRGRLFSKSSFAALAGTVYISMPLGMLLWLVFIGAVARPGTCSLGLGNYMILFIICSIWINDTMAYITGSLFGRTPLTKISPKKTREGTAGGILLCVLIMSLAGRYLLPFSYLPVKTWIIISAVCAIAGTFGDLLESKLKRLAGIKDSGSLMPGHGGFLDRFDSLLAALPFVWIYVKYIAS